MAEDAVLGAGVDGLGLAVDGAGVEGDGLGVEDDGDGAALEGLGVDDEGLGVGDNDKFFGCGVLFAVGEGPLVGEGLTPSLVKAFGVGELGAGLPNTVSAERVVSLTFSSFGSGFLGLVAS
jgi:hypothetical protein